MNTTVKNRYEMKKIANIDAASAASVLDFVKKNKIPHDFIDSFSKGMRPVEYGYSTCSDIVEEWDEIVKQGSNPAEYYYYGCQDRMSGPSFSSPKSEGIISTGGYGTVSHFLVDMGEFSRDQWLSMSRQGPSVDIDCFGKYFSYSRCHETAKRIFNLLPGWKMGVKILRDCTLFTAYKDKSGFELYVYLWGQGGIQYISDTSASALECVANGGEIGIVWDNVTKQTYFGYISPGSEPWQY